jgi:hypothetical protein
LKISVAFFGIPRNSTVCFPSIQKNILDALPSTAEVTCYYHLYRQQEVINLRSGEAGILDEENYAPFLSMSGLLEEPDSCLARWNFDLIKRRGDAWDDDFWSLRNLIHQLNSLHAVTDLLIPSQPDYVIFARPDVFYHDPLPTSVFSRIHARPQTLYIPSWQWWDGVNDRLAICGRDTYQAYGHRIESITDFFDRYRGPLHSERLLKYALKINDVGVRTIDTRLSRVRIDGQFKQESFSPTRTAGLRNFTFHPISQIRTLLDRRNPPGVVAEGLGHV